MATVLRMHEPLGHGAVLLFLGQLFLLVVFTRIGAVIASRLRQPPVVGELAAGIALGPTILGHFAPGLFARLFPSGEPMRLIEAVSWLGMVLLMLTTGLETDVRLLRHLGRPALTVSVGGMLVPFAGGWLLGASLSGSLVPAGTDRTLFCAFLATAMAISAMPVISRILLDLGLMHRNLGLLALSAGVVDDATGWLLLSLIAGLAGDGGGAGRVAFVAAGLLAFIVTVRWALFPMVARLLRWVDDELTLSGTDLAVCIATALGSAAVTQALGVHAVFGAFLAGLLLRQAPRLRPESMERLSQGALGLLSPVFFAFVGLRVDLWTLPGLFVSLLFLGVASAGKLVGCYVGGRLGRLSRWESLALGVAMNARGAMELVVATIGLSLGILDDRTFSLLVLVALSTSVVTPILLSRMAARLPESREEAARLDARHHQGLSLSSARIVTGSDEAIAGARALEMALMLASGPDATVVALHRDAREERSLLGALWGGARAQIARLQEAGRAVPGKVTLRPVKGRVAESLMAQARGAALVILGSSSWPPPMPSRERDDSGGIVCVLRPKRGGKARHEQLLVPTDGSASSRLSVEVALAYAFSAGARVTLLHVMERPMWNPLLPHRGLPVESARRLVETTLHRSLAPLMDALPKGPRPEVRVQVLEGAPVNALIVRETQLGPYDLLVVNASGKSLHEGPFLGYGTEFLVEESACSVLCVLGG